MFVVSLACSAPIIGEDDPEGGDDTFVPSPPSHLGDVVVTPRSGSGEFTVDVGYFWNLADTDFAITCTFPAPDGSQTSMPLPVTQQGGSAQFKFSIAKPGTYNVSCKAAGYGNSASAFDVTGAEQAGESSPVETVEPKHFTQASLSIDRQTVMATSGDNVNVFFCTPSAWWAGTEDFAFTVSPEGSLDGRCSVAPYDYQPTTAFLIGHWNKETGEVSFHLQAHTIVNPNDAKQANWLVVIDGSGSFISDNAARGKATWTNTCDAHPDVSCYDLTNHKEAAGELDWTIEFRE